MSLTLKAENIARYYNGNAVLENCSFDFDKSGVYSLMGDNGTGKSTFLKIYALLEKPDSGSVSFYSNGEPVLKDIMLRRRISLVLPDNGIFNTSVFNNAAYGLKVRGITGNEMRCKAEEAFDAVGLIHKIKQNALTLSSGETMRLGIARALAIEPEIFLLDEPTASIDRRNTEIINGIIGSTKENKKNIIIMTTHDKTQAEKLADFILTIGNGQIHRGF